MSIRKEISSWNGKMFMRIALAVFVIFNGMILFANFLDGKSLLTFSFNWVFSGLVQPLLWAAIFTNASRKMTLYVNDFNDTESFQDKLNKSILNKRVNPDKADKTTARYVATGWYYKLFNNWDGSETVSVTWGNEVVIEGSSRIVSQVEDSLIWNSAFKK